MWSSPKILTLAMNRSSIVLKPLSGWLGINIFSHIKYLEIGPIVFAIDLAFKTDFHIRNSIEIQSVTNCIGALVKLKFNSLRGIYLDNIE